MTKNPAIQINPGLRDCILCIEIFEIPFCYRWWYEKLGYIFPSDLRPIRRTNQNPSASSLSNLQNIQRLLKMPPLKVGDSIPAVKFKYIAYTPETSDIVACGTIQEFDAQKVNLLRTIRLRNWELILCAGIQGKEGSVVCCTWRIYTWMSSQTSPSLR